MSSLYELVEVIVFSIASDKEKVQIETEESEDFLLFKITASKADTGKLIGKKGRVAESLRVLIKAAGVKQGKRVSINVMKDPLE